MGERIRPRLKKLAAWGGAGLLGLLALALGLGLWAHEPRPEGEAGPAAEALAARVERAVGLDGWERTGAVRWTFAGAHRHLWDRERDLARVRWGEGDDAVEAQLRLDRGAAYVTRGGAEVTGDEARALADEAYAYFINDAFWLYPFRTFRDEGVRLARVRDDGGEGLLVAYGAGGLTPGDAYLWGLGEDGTPRVWAMWVSIIPIGGVRTSWEGWTTLSTGARVATRHAGPFGLELAIDDVAGAETLSGLIEGPDPFDASLR